MFLIYKHANEFCLVRAVCKKVTHDNDVELNYQKIQIILFLIVELAHPGCPRL